MWRFGQGPSCSPHRFVSQSSMEEVISIFVQFYAPVQRYFVHKQYEFENYLDLMYLNELEIKDTTERNSTVSYQDLLLLNVRDGQLHTFIYDKQNDFNFHIWNFPFWEVIFHLSSFYDKRDDFNFHNTNFPFLSISSPAYGVFISKLIRYVRAPSSYAFFILRVVRFHLSSSDKDMSWNVWNRPSESFMVVMGISSNIMKSPSPKCYMTFCDIPYTVTPSIDQTFHQFVNLLPNWTLLPILTVFPNFERSWNIATGAASQQRTLTPPDTWSCPIGDLHLF